MEFLAGLKEAMSHGVTKDEYLDVWNKEMDIEASMTTTRTSLTAGLSPYTDDTHKDEYLILLKEILEQQQQLKHQQDNIQQQLINLQASYLEEQNKVQSQHDEKYNHLLGKLTALENSVAKMQLTLVDSVRKTMTAGSMEIQDKLSLMTETIHNHILEEMRRIKSVSSGIEETSTKFKGKIKGKKQSCRDKEFSEDKNVNKKVVEERTENVKNANFGSDIEMPSTLADVLHYELNSFLLNVQKLLLRPISSEDLSFLVTEKIQEFCQQERENIVDQLLNIQVALSSDFSARLYKSELHLIQELKDMSRQLNQQGQMESIMLECQKMVKEINEVKDVLHLTLPRTILSLVKSQTSSEVSRSKQEDVLTGTYPVEAANDQLLSLVMLMSLYMIVFVLHNIESHRFTSSEKIKKITRSESEINMPDHDSSTWASGSMKNAESLASLLNVDVEDFDHPFSKTGYVHRSPKFLGGYEEVKLQWEINYTDLSLEEDVFKEVKHVPPGYILQLRATKFAESENLNFFVRSGRGKINSILNWPADFVFVIEPVPKYILGSKKKPNRRFEKMRSLNPPRQHDKNSGVSLCFLTKLDLTTNYIHNNLVTVNFYIKYIGSEVEEAAEEV